VAPDKERYSKGQGAGLVNCVSDGKKNEKFPSSAEKIEENGFADGSALPASHLDDAWEGTIQQSNPQGEGLESTGWDCESRTVACRPPSSQRLGAAEVTGASDKCFCCRATLAFRAWAAWSLFTDTPQSASNDVET